MSLKVSQPKSGGKAGKGDKPKKPYADFPLFAHATRRWAKKIRGRLHYFGRWDDPDGALAKYLDQKDDLQSGLTTRANADGLTVRDLLNRFLTSKRHLVDARELTPRTFADYHQTCKWIADVFGLHRLVDDLAADDFERLRAGMAKTWGPVRLGNQIQRVRTVFKYAYDAGLVDKPIRYGPTFKRPSRRVLRRQRQAAGVRMFEAHELRAILETAGQPLKTMVLLGVNCGLGNTDVAMLPRGALDLKKGWIDYPRPKTGMDRRCPLWPETVAAIQEASVVRPQPTNKADRGYLFITRRGATWFKIGPEPTAGTEPKVTVDNPVTKEFSKLIRKLGIHRPRLGFYALRHTFATVAGESMDHPAVDLIMGHAREDMASVYRERISDARLRAVVEHVRRWLFSTEEDQVTKTE